MPLAKVIAERPDVFNHNVEVVPRLYPVARRGSTLAALAARAAQREGDGRRRGRDEVRPDGRPRRDARRDGRGVRRAARAAACRSSPSASTCARPSATCRSCATGTPTSSRRSRRPRYALGFDHVAAGPLVRSSYHADEHVPQARPASGRWPRRQPASLQRVFPLRDNIPTERFPVVTVALIVAERASCTSSCSRRAGSTSATRSSRLPAEPRSTTARSRTRSRTRASTATVRAGAVACEGMSA